MTRLQRHRHKQLTFSIILASVIFIVLLVFIFTLGIKLLLNTSIFVADLARPKTDNVKKNNHDTLVASINIIDIPTATNSLKFVVAGRAFNYDKLDFYLNEDKVKEIKLDKDNFTEEIGDLKEESNEFYIVGTVEEAKKTQESQRYSIFYKKGKPMLEVSEPQDRSTVLTREIKVAGVTDKEVFIKVSQLPVVVDVEGRFQTIIRLADGENKIEITAQDIAGNIEKKEIVVTYSKD